VCLFRVLWSLLLYTMFSICSHRQFQIVTLINIFGVVTQVSKIMATIRTVNTQTFPLILAVDRGGRPAEWVNWRQAVGHYMAGDVMWTVGDPAAVVRGGTNRLGVRSKVDLHPVIAVAGADAIRFEDYTIPLNNKNLFARDGVCLYCGEKYAKGDLSRDHVIPVGQGGVDTWENVVTACKPCNHRKACQTPAQAGMELLALPYAPSHIEGLILANRNILVDQAAFLSLQIPNARKRQLL